MHEAAIARHLIEAISGRIDDGLVTGRIASIHLLVGELTAVLPDNLRRYFDILAEGSALQGAELKIEATPVRLSCRSCGADSEPRRGIFECERCGSGDTAVAGGDELKIVSVEVN
jgi:hydrogenase nickel incorporation protein HypA/HybF